MTRLDQKKSHLLEQIMGILESGMAHREVVDELRLTGYATC